MIVVTGGAGMIGSNVVAALNRIGRDDIIIVDNLKNGRKFFNLKGLCFSDYIDKSDFIDLIKLNLFKWNIDVIFHLGACSATTEWDGDYLMKNNYEYSKVLLDYCVANNISFVYASSASVYGVKYSNFAELAENEDPINMYAYSKFIFDEYVRLKIKNEVSSLIVGLRYFNVYGPNENHKGSMASTVFHFNNQLKSNNSVKLFEGSQGYANGEQMRDFVYVKDCALANIWFLNKSNPKLSGIYNIGTGVARTFNDVAEEVIRYFGRGSISYIPFPNHLIGSYQSYTCANMDNFNNITNGEIHFRSIELGIKDYLEELNT